MTITIQPAAKIEPSCHARPELWFSERSDGRALAVHTCRTHCPLLDACRKAAADLSCPYAIQGGVLYGSDGLPVKQQPRSSTAHCVDCGGTPLPSDDRRPPSVFVDCGTYTAYRRHRRHHEEPCEPCVEANRQRERDRRVAYREQAANPCGSVAGIKRHHTAGEPLCEDCVQAQREASAHAHAAEVGNEATQTARAQLVRQLAGLGLSDTQIGARLGMSKRRIRRLRMVHGVPSGWLTVHGGGVAA